MQCACDIYKLMSDRKTGYIPLILETDRSVTNDVTFAYAHKTKKKKTL